MYHSALKPELPVGGELERYESSGSLVFCHDISTGMSPEFTRVDAIYAEPSWRAGYGIFMARAGIAGRGFSLYLEGMLSVIKYLRAPSYLLVGKHMLKVLEPPEVVPTHIHGYPCFLGIWYADAASIRSAIEGQATAEALSYVADRYARVLDFSCGYGNTAGAMRSRGKSFVCSDVNKKCVYQIAKDYMGYGS